MDVRLFCVTLLAAGSAWSAIAQTPERLRIEVVDVRVAPIGEDPSPHFFPPHGGHDAIVAVHEAMRLLKVPAELYDVSYSDDSPVYHCSRADTVFTSRCIYNRESELSAEESNNLHRALGYEAAVDEPTPLEPGEIVLLIVSKSPAFALSSELLGRTTVSTWNGWAHEDMDWSTMACSGWAHLHVPTVAHELGHCFGLHHNGIGDPNWFSLDTSVFYGLVDLMKEHWSPLDPNELGPNNQARVDHHFRVLDTEPATSAVPMSRTFQ